jgi:phosphoglycolate phosphatase
MAKTFDGWTIVFDLDGTLVDTAPDLLIALNHVLQKTGHRPVTMDGIHTIIGSGAKAMIRQGLKLQDSSLPESEIDALWHDFIAHYTANISAQSRPFDGAIETLNTLANQGAILAVCTNKLQSLSDELLSALDMQGHFAAVVGADSVPNHKPHGDHILLTINAAGGIPARSIMVGDSQTDKKAARNAGLPFVFVPFGYESDTADQIGADAVVTDYSGMVSALSGLIS